MKTNIMKDRLYTSIVNVERTPEGDQIVDLRVIRNGNEVYPIIITEQNGEEKKQIPFTLHTSMKQETVKNIVEKYGGTWA